MTILQALSFVNIYPSETMVVALSCLFIKFKMFSTLIMLITCSYKNKMKLVARYFTSFSFILEYETPT